MNIKSYTLAIPGLIEVTFLNYGGIIQSLRTPDNTGELVDVVLGFEDPEDYRRCTHPYFGGLIGRYANRIKNSHYQIDGRDFTLVPNQGTTSLHGGAIGLDKKFWEVSANPDQTSYTLRLVSPDGDQGHPGELQIEVTYRVTPGPALTIHYEARTSAPTAINLTNHSYFNLSGGVDSILDHELWLGADRFTEVDEGLVPTGKILPVSGATDFRTPQKIGRDAVILNGGLDYNFVLNEAPPSSAQARLTYPRTGLRLEVFTTEPGLQVYSGHKLNGKLRGKRNQAYEKFAGICLEAQHFPDSPHHDHFPSTILRPGETFQATTTYKFSTSSRE